LVMKLSMMLNFSLVNKEEKKLRMKVLVLSNRARTGFII